MLITHEQGGLIVLNHRTNLSFVVNHQSLLVCGILAFLCALTFRNEIIEALFHDAASLVSIGCVVCSINHRVFIYGVDVAPDLI